MTEINAIVLAGDNKKDFIQSGVENKSLLPIYEKPMVEYVVDALRSSSHIGKISISGPEGLLKSVLGKKVDFYVGDKDSLFDSVKAGLSPFIDDSAVLVVTSDIPMITGEMITDFIKLSFDQGGDFCYPIVNKQLNDVQFPSVERTYVRLKEGTFTGGNIIFLKPTKWEPCEEFAQNMIQYRKQPWKIAKLLGVKFLLGLLMGNLSITEVEERVHELLSIEASAIIVDYPEIGNDVDKHSDVEMVMKYFESEGRFF
ncbi:MAG: NTP transferase domain-containing protein [Clostridiales bacterium]|nr:NTP transferase domain-containing protein [Clostridiales bacterium]